MTTKRTLALAALLVAGTSATTGLARRNPEDALTDRAMVSRTVWMAIKCALLQQYFENVREPLAKSLSSVSPNAEVNQKVMDAVAAGVFLTQMKEYFEDVAAWTWDKVEPVAEQLPQPFRSLVCDC